jgi:hypothetical protein
MALGFSPDGTLYGVNALGDEEQSLSVRHRDR